MKLVFTRKDRSTTMSGEVADGDYNAALDAGIAICRHWGGDPVRIYTEDQEPVGVVTVALVESEADMEALGA